MAAINQGNLPQINRNDPDYVRKINELANSIASGNTPGAAADAEPAKIRTAAAYDRTTFDDGGEPDVDLPVVGTAEAGKAVPGGRHVVRFTDDIGDDQEVEIDLGDVGQVTDLARRARMSDNLTQEIAALRDEMAGKMTAAQADMEKAQRYLKLEASGSREAILDEMFKSDGGYEGLRTKIIDEFKGYEAMTKDERREFDVSRMQAESARKMAELEKRLDEKSRDADRRSDDANRNARVAVLKTVFGKYKFDNASSDPAIDKINMMVFNEAQSNIKALEAQRVTVTENILNREFKRAHQLFKGKVNVGAPAVKVDPARAIADQADAAMAAAQTLAAQSQNSSGGNTDSEVIGRWVGMLREGKGMAVTSEASKSPKLQKLYAKLANMLSRDRTLLTAK